MYVSIAVSVDSAVANGLDNFYILCVVYSWQSQRFSQVTALLRRSCVRLLQLTYTSVSRLLSLEETLKELTWSVMFSLLSRPCIIIDIFVR